MNEKSAISRVLFGSILLMISSCCEGKMSKMNDLGINIPNRLILSMPNSQAGGEFDQDYTYLIKLDDIIIDEKNSPLKYLDNRNIYESRLIEIIPSYSYSVEFEDEIDSELYDVLDKSPEGSLYTSTTVRYLYRKYDESGRRIVSCYNDLNKEFGTECMSTLYLDRVVIEFRTVGLSVNDLSEVTKEVRDVLSSWMI